MCSGCTQHTTVRWVCAGALENVILIERCTVRMGCCGLLVPAMGSFLVIAIPATTAVASVSRSGSSSATACPGNASTGLAVLVTVIPAATAVVSISRPGCSSTTACPGNTSTGRAGLVIVIPAAIAAASVSCPGCSSTTAFPGNMYMVSAGCRRFLPGRQIGFLLIVTFGFSVRAVKRLKRW